MQTCSKGHSILQTQCLECQKLQAFWTSQLLSSNFKDIEDGDFFTDHQSPSYLQEKKDCKSYEIYQEKQSYYQWARSKAADGFFHSWKDRVIWEHHAEGISQRKISKNIGFDQSWISRRITKIKTYLHTNSIASMSAYAQLNLF